MEPSSKPDPSRRRAGWRAWLLAVWLILLGASHVVRWFEEPPPVRAGVSSAELSEIDGDRVLDRGVRVAWLDEGGDDPSRPVVLLLHGSPGNKENFAGMLPALAARFRVLAPDLPGFGESEREVADYSVRAHARYLIELLDRLSVKRVHVVGFSMGGGVGLELYDLAPQRVASLTLLSAIGVQELELFGDYRLNHLVHAGQLGAIGSILELTPHFGWLDDTFFGIPYARNFYDTDQRPLRGILERFEPPMLVLHGDRDFLVAPEAAIEHHRIVPQSELAMLDASHFMVFSRPGEMADRVGAWVERVEAGQAPRRADATPERLVAAARPYDPRTAPPFSGFALVLAMGMIALATLVSEDLTCVATGLIAAQGRIGYLPGVIGCFVGIFVGDVLLYLAGRFLGRPALRHAPLRWMLNERQVIAASNWLDRRGPVVVLLSRFLPGFRLPTYFAAGTLHTRFGSFGVWFLLAAFIWTPLLVWISMRVGESAFGYLEWLERHTLLALVVLGLWIFVVVKLVMPLLTFRGRRTLLGRWRRLRQWEFWPVWLFYIPVVLRIAWLGLKHRSPFLFTAANPAMPAGGFVSEPKGEIMRGLAPAGERVAATEFLPCALYAAQRVERVERVERFMRERGLDWPVVLKPDAGQRGSGVVIARDREAVERYLGAAEFDALVQEYAPGREFGVFYTRLPGEPRGQIFSVTEKRLPEIEGDGVHTVERLILRDRRAVCMAQTYLEAQADRLEEVPAAGEKITLVQLGTHCRGAIFLDGGWVVTPELERAIEEISRVYDGFWFGRYDIRTEDVEALKRGRGFKVIELNGVTSESTNIYDPKFGLFEAWRTLFRQWSLAFEIGRRNRERGVEPTSPAELIRLARRYRETSRTHPT